MGFVKTSFSDPHLSKIWDAFWGPSGFADPSGSQNGEPIPIRGQNSATFSRLGSLKLAFLGPLGPKIGQIDWVLTSGRSKFAPPEGKSALGPQILASRGQNQGPGLGSGVPDPRTGLPEGRFGLQRSKMTSGRPKIGLPDLKNRSNFPHFENEKNCPVLFWTT